MENKDKQNINDAEHATAKPKKAANIPNWPGKGFAGKGGGAPKNFGGGKTQKNYNKY